MKGCDRRLGLLETSVLFCLFVAEPTAAQIVPDATLPNNSTVNLQGTRSVIEGGTTAGGNLFHSFREFSVPTGGSAFFNNTGDIQNIFSRVTGGNISNIDGLIRANGIANLFLLNPNGIIFGPNASLNIGGSFLASTANSFKFADGAEFSATNPSAPPLLTINVPIGLQFGTNPGSIVNRSRLTDRNNVPLGLQVPLGQTIALVGGDVLLEGGSLTAPEGRIELGSVADSGLVSLNPTAQGLALDYQGVSTFRDIQLSQGASATANGEGGGSIQVQGRRLTLTDGSQINAATLGAKPGGTVNVRTSESVELTGTSPDGQTATNLGTTTLGTGDGGDVTIQTGRLILRNGAGAGSATALGQGNAGNVSVNASESVELIGTSPNGQNQSLLGAGTFGSTGDAGNVTIQTRRLIVRDGAGVFVGTILGGGNAGNVTVNASESVELIGTSPNGQMASALAAGTVGGTGNAGNVTVQTRQLTVRDGATILARSRASQGDAGNVTVKASESVELIGASTYIFTSTSSVADAASNFTISEIGDAGNVTIETGRLIIRDGASVVANSRGKGNAGNVIVNAFESVELIGTSPDGQNLSSLNVETLGSGDAGNVMIKTGRLILRDGAVVEASTSDGEGNAGNVTVNASESVELIAGSGLVAASFGDGDAGNVKIETGRLILRDGAVVGAVTGGKGNAGTITVNASESVELIGTSPNGQLRSGLFARTVSSGDAGSVTIQTGRLIVQNGAQVDASTILGEGNGGTVAVNASELVELSGNSPNLNSGSGLGTFSIGGGDAGNVTIETGRLILRDGAFIVAGTLLGSGNAGTVTVNASESVELSGTSPNNLLRSGLNAASFNAGNSGDLKITTGQLIVRDGAEINVTSQNVVGINNEALIDVVNNSLGDIDIDIDIGFLNSVAGNLGNPGNINITARDMRLDNQARLSATSDIGQGGNIQVRSRNIQLRNQSQINAAGSLNLPTTEGSIDIQSQSLVLLEGSRIITSANDPRGGSNIAIAPRNDLGLAVFQSLDSIINARGELNIEGDIQPDPPDIPQI
ncbi:two-partner secretion domain-containing protein, partial [Microseira wollei]|uniref:two-partner secretion domain-containing protein n=1 Tax=Microseira wollei TaxID=467598 RepID=UPI001CFF3732